MDPKLCLLVVLLLAAMMDLQVEAENESRPELWDTNSEVKDKIGKFTWEQLLRSLLEEEKTSHAETESEFYFQHVLPKEKDLEKLDLKCVPGRTVIQIIEKPPEPDTEESGEDDDEVAGDMLRSHMNTGMNEEYCKVCVCSVEGKDEYCSQRPAMNVNECLRMTKIIDEYRSNLPFDHTRTLAYRIRRDYIWHNDEIPYDSKAKCQRAHSYYTNSDTANNTDIDVASDVESLLDYGDKDICYYCVCSVDAKTAGCISRKPWFCEYYRLIRQVGYSRDRYTKLFQQDRPTYFRQLSWRLRRTMDDGIFDFMEAGGDTLCCSHPDGHRRSIHNTVRNKIRGMRKKVVKENLMSGFPGGDYTDFIVNNDK